MTDRPISVDHPDIPGLRFDFEVTLAWDAGDRLLHEAPKWDAESAKLLCGWIGDLQLTPEQVAAIGDGWTGLAARAEEAKGMAETELANGYQEAAE